MWKAAVAIFIYAVTTSSETIYEPHKPYISNIGFQVKQGDQKLLSHIGP